MRYHMILSFVAITILGCGNGPVDRSPNRWADERLWPVLEAQEHRNTQALCALLKDGSATVRGAAALAFASVQDSGAIPCLLDALLDQDIDVRRHAVFALGFIAGDSAVDHMAHLLDLERDSVVQQTYRAARFVNQQRRGRFTTGEPILAYLEQSIGHERARAADALRRLPDSTLRHIRAAYLDLLDTTRSDEAEPHLLLGLWRFGDAEAWSLLRASSKNGKPDPVRANALRALSMKLDAADADLFLGAVQDDAIGTVAVDAIRAQHTIEPERIRAALERIDDSILVTRLLGAIGQHPGGDSLRAAPRQTALNDRSPYVRAEAVLAHPIGYGVLSFNEATDLMADTSAHPAIRQAAFAAAVREQEARRMAQYQPVVRPREEQMIAWRSPINEALRTGDAGLICAALEQLLTAGGDPNGLVVDEALEKTMRDTLHPLADLEALRLLDQLIATRDTGHAFTPLPVPFNHPIDPVKLKALEQGQRYRIITNKGTIIIATDVDQSPGTSLAFDSLVVADYYDGKAFHRMVPNFVVQGGCPRGDGYGGMPWTLRTEIGRTPFTTGSVGLASAGRDTESCQFFITHSAAPHLDGRYTRFGEVVSGMDVVWKLQVGDVMEKVERIN